MKLLVVALLSTAFGDTADNKVWHSPLVFSGTCTDVNPNRKCSKISIWYIYKGEELLTSEMKKTIDVDGFPQDILWNLDSNNSNVKKDQTRVFFGHISEQNQVQLFDKEENVYLKKLDRIARVSAFQKSNPNSRIEDLAAADFDVKETPSTTVPTATVASAKPSITTEYVQEPEIVPTESQSDPERTITEINTTAKVLTEVVEPEININPVVESEPIEDRKPNTPQPEAEPEVEPEVVDPQQEDDKPQQPPIEDETYKPLDETTGNVQEGNAYELVDEYTPGADRGSIDDYTLPGNDQSSENSGAITDTEAQEPPIEPPIEPTAPLPTDLEYPTISIVTEKAKESASKPVEPVEPVEIVDPVEPALPGEITELGSGDGDESDSYSDDEDNFSRSNSYSEEYSSQEEELVRSRRHKYKRAVPEPEVWDEFENEMEAMYIQ